MWRTCCSEIERRGQCVRQQRGGGCELWQHRRERREPVGEGGSADTSAPFVAVVAGAKAAAKEAAAALKQQRLLLLPRVRELYVSVVLAGMAEAQRELGLCLAGLDEGSWQGACTRGASAQAAARTAAATSVTAARTTGRSPLANLEVRAR